ncbi:MAG: hypothetical protein K2Y29_14180 [Beijerinckiaceae bacterium]|nr:hypothetical protein [Beijerinckiaceae bacterium]
MQFICDAPGGKTWFLIESEKEASDESALMQHAVEKYFLRAREDAQRTYVPTSRAFIEQDIGRADHARKAMPQFATLRDAEGAGLATAMLPPRAGGSGAFTPIVVGPANRDPYPDHGDAIATLGAHFNLTLDRERCFPYRR